MTAASSLASCVTIYVSEKSFPASAQFSFLMSVRMICTASAGQPSARQVPSVSSFASLRRWSRVRPSNISTWMVGIAYLPCSELVIDGDVAGLRLHACQPGSDVRIARQVEPALVRHVRVAVEGDVGEAVAVVDEERIGREMLFHHVECGVALLHDVGQGRFLLRRELVEEVLPEARHGHVGFVAVLLEEHPLQ